jgi:FecR protein
VLLLRENTKRGTRRKTPSPRRVSPFSCVALYRVVALTALSLWAALPPCVAQTPGSVPTNVPFAGALISDWSGSVQVQMPGAKQGHPVRGQILPEGTILDTGSGQLVLVLRSDESEVLVQPHTKLVLHEPQPGTWDTLQIMIGRVRAFIRKRTGGAPPFQMGTPSAVIAVRGTRFDVEVNSRGISEIDVFDGLVEVGSVTLPGVSVLVSPGMSTRVGIGTAPEAPVPTRDIRPDVEAPDQIGKLEFAREKALQADRVWGTEFGERPDAEVGEVVDESRESEKGKH